MDNRAQLVYGTPTNAPPHGFARNAASRTAKFIAVRLVSGPGFKGVTSFRLMLGELGRGVAAYVGSGVYLDVALTWVMDRTAACPVVFRDEGDRRSGYSLRKLMSHFWQLVLTAGTRPLRLVSVVGGVTALLGLILAVVLIAGRLSNRITAEGWTSVVAVNLLIGGGVLFALGVIAEYVGVAVRMAMGKPLYLITSDPADGPLHRDEDAESGLGE
jgi:hypothetical protein